MATPVVRIALPFDEAALLELVEEPDQLAAVVAEGVGDLALRLWCTLADDEENRMVIRVQPLCFVGFERALLDGKAQALQQERRRPDELIGQLRRRPRGWGCDIHAKKSSAPNGCPAITLKYSMIRRKTE
jgi:hypothetical protein